MRVSSAKWLAWKITAGELGLTKIIIQCVLLLFVLKPVAVASHWLETRERPMWASVIEHRQNRYVGCTLVHRLASDADSDATVDVIQQPSVSILLVCFHCLANNCWTYISCEMQMACVWSLCKIANNYYGLPLQCWLVRSYVIDGLSVSSWVWCYTAHQRCVSKTAVAAHSCSSWLAQLAGRPVSRDLGGPSIGWVNGWVLRIKYKAYLLIKRVY